MSFQFAHIATYSRKGNGTSRSSTAIALEAARVPGNAPHVQQPVAPNILYGMDPSLVPAEIERRVSAAKAALKGGGRGGGIRQDTHVLSTAVFSHPTPTLALSEDAALRREYQAWRGDTIQFALADAEKRGLDVLSVVEHRVDEAFPHLHVLACARNARMDAKSCHPGHAAVKALDPSPAPGDARKAYCDAMRSWQDEYSAQVAAKHGLTRLGPGKRRLSRAAWKAEQAEAKRAASRVAEIERAERLAAAAKDEAAKIAGRLQIAVAQIEADRVHLDKEIFRSQERMAEISACRVAAEEAVARLEAVETGVRAWATGDIERAGLTKDNRWGVKWRDELTADRIRAITDKMRPAWDLACQTVKRIGDMLKDAAPTVRRAAGADLARHLLALTREVYPPFRQALPAKPQAAISEPPESGTLSSGPSFYE